MSTIEVCRQNCTNPEALSNAQSALPDENTAKRLVNFYRIFGDQARIRIISALSAGELCVCDLAEVLGMSQSAVSHQLRLLKQEYLVKFRKEGKTVFYSLEDEHILQIFKIGMEHIKERKI